MSEFLSKNHSSPYIEMETPGEQAAAAATTFGMFYFSAASAGRTPAPSFGTSTEVETAGSIRNVNPFECKTNCVSTSIATDATLAGQPASALRSGVTPISVLEKTFGGKFSAMTRDGIAAELTTAGPGARGIVFGARGIRQPGHVFNGINQNGVVRFLDGQSGKPANWDGYRSFHFLRTN